MRKQSGIVNVDMRGRLITYEYFSVQLQAHVALIRGLPQDRKQKSFLWNSLKLAGFMSSNVSVTLEPHVAHYDGSAKATALC
jgi:hypothetical protein